jgi:2-dehydrotetronate isomerase
MPRFAANLSMMYGAVPFMQSFAAAARDGFKAVEFLFPYAFDAQAIAEQLAQHQLVNVLFNAPPGDWQAGERGLAVLPGRELEFRASIDQAIAYARVLRTPCVHVMAGIVPASASTPERSKMRSIYLRNLRFAAERCAEQGITALIEPINTRDMPGYFLNRQDHAHEILSEVDHPHLKVQMDLYHCQIVEGDVSTKLQRYLPTGNVAHIQVAGVPGRNEPDSGELNYRHIFKLIDELGYDGLIGSEYRPVTHLPESFSWMNTWQ